MNPLAGLAFVFAAFAVAGGMVYTPHAEGYVWAALFAAAGAGVQWGPALVARVQRWRQRRRALARLLVLGAALAREQDREP